MYVVCVWLCAGRYWCVSGNVSVHASGCVMVSTCVHWCVSYVYSSRLFVPVCVEFLSIGVNLAYQRMHVCVYWCVIVCIWACFVHQCGSGYIFVCYCVWVWRVSKHVCLGVYLCEFIMFPGMCVCICECVGVWVYSYVFSCVWIVYLWLVRYIAVCFF